MFVRLTPGSLTKWLPWVRGVNVQGDKNTRFRAPAFSPTQAPCNIHAAITMRFVALCTWQHNVTPIIQPFQCDLQPQLPKHRVTTRKWATTRCRTPRENRFDDETSAAAPAPHTHKVPFIEAILPGKTQGPASSPTRAPCNIHAAFTMRFAASRGKLIHHSTHMATQRDTNHTAIPMRSATTASKTPCDYAHMNNHSLQNTKREPIRRAQLHPPHTRGTYSSPAEATWHGKTHGFVLQLPPNTSPETFMQPLQCVLHHHMANTRLSTHMATKHDKNVVPPYMNLLLCDIKSHTALHDCIVVWCKKSHTALHECIVMWCKVSHAVHECIVMWCKVSHQPSIPFMHVKFHTTLHWVKVTRNSEDCFPTSFDNDHCFYYWGLCA